MARDVQIRFTTSGGPQASQAMRDVATSTDGVTKSVALGTAAGELMAKGFGLLVDAGRKVVGLFADWFNGAQAAELASVRLNMQVENTYRNTGVLMPMLDDLAAKFTDLAGGEDDAVRGAESVLLKFGNITQQTFPQALETSVDMAAMFGITVPQAANALGLAMQYPERATESLRAAGIMLTAAQSEQIKKLVESGDRWGATRLILQYVSDYTKGAAAAAAETLTGKWALFTNKLDDAGKGIAAKFLPIVKGLVNDVLLPAVPKVQQFAEAFGDWLVNALKDAGAWVNDHFVPLLRALQPVFDWLLNVVRGAWGAIQAVFQSVVGILAADFTFFTDLLSGRWNRLWVDLSQILSSSGSGIVMVIANLWNSVVADTLQSWFGIDLHIKGSWADIKEYISITLQWLGLWIGWYWQHTIPDAIKAGLKAITDWVSTAWDNVKKWTTDTWNAITKWISDAWNNIGKSVQNWYNDLPWWAKALINGQTRAFQFNITTSMQQRQGGGPVLPGVPYVVGERGPEVFVPSGGGYIQPNVTHNWNYSPTYGGAPTNEPQSAFSMMHMLALASI